MGPLIAIVADTWRQSRHQVVFMLLLVILLVLSIVPTVIANPVTLPDENGEQVEHVRLLNFEESEVLLEGMWAMTYAQSIMLNRDEDDEGEPLDPFSPEGQALQEEMERIEELVEDTPHKQRAVEALISAVSGMVFTISMLLFIAAASGYFPSMLDAGAIDIVLAKPVERWKVYLGKYLGGLALFASALFACYTLMFLGLGIRTGVWAMDVFLVMPLQLLAAATLFALLALIGVITRSTNLCMILGFVYYLVVDSVLQILAIIPFEVEWLETVQKIIRYGIPNFGMLKTAAQISPINAPAVPWEQVGVAAVWIVLSTAVGYWRFRSTDY
ncbi:hypothetical protein PPSIR1_05263 [Plesiocystis pacifica SIR-1]|uniref:Uncharacterized protein n=1 Tax=Plesiocystis pacifica SIR-1 TaxID=391625 RepID=A6FX25_9BACT|nr:ABC transporter permease subunit [Plesiocystis pacifica]EDM81849.1 hypothetical protein PPSIR1_05263 [Plesiocystis pacifica SIR-1]